MMALGAGRRFSSKSFVIDKYIEDARQDEKHVPDLLELIIRH